MELLRLQGSLLDAACQMAKRHEQPGCTGAMCLTCAYFGCGTAPHQKGAQHVLVLVDDVVAVHHVVAQVRAIACRKDDLADVCPASSGARAGRILCL
jgi:hypothetical protein